jgi:DNA-binding MurR/RpiR family transcriptional regulator
MTSTPIDLIRERFAALSPELQRASRWLADHPSDVGVMSMRQQARAVGVSPPTMSRLARALGFPDYAALRRAFQDALAGPAPRYREQAEALQSGQRGKPMARLMGELRNAQMDDVRSTTELNDPGAVEAAVDALCRASRIGFLGVRSSFGIAYLFHYAHKLLSDNGELITGLGGGLIDQIDGFGPRDALVAITLAPYSRPTVDAVRLAHERRVTVVAITDSALSPLAAYASHTLLFRTDSLSFFHSMLAPVALVELLLARQAARGGRAVLARLARIDGQMTARQAYWQARPSRRI